MRELSLLARLQLSSYKRGLELGRLRRLYRLDLALLVRFTSVLEALLAPASSPSERSDGAGYFRKP